MLSAKLRWLGCLVEPGDTPTELGQLRHARDRRDEAPEVGRVRGSLGRLRPIAPRVLAEQLHLVRPVRGQPEEPVVGRVEDLLPLGQNLREALGRLARVGMALRQHRAGPRLVAEVRDNPDRLLRGGVRPILVRQELDARVGGPRVPEDLGTGRHREAGVLAALGVEPGPVVRLEQRPVGRLLREPPVLRELPVEVVAALEEPERRVPDPDRVGRHPALEAQLRRVAGPLVEVDPAVPAELPPLPPRHHRPPPRSSPRRSW